MKFEHVIVGLGIAVLTAMFRDELTTLAKKYGLL